MKELSMTYLLIHVMRNNVYHRWMLKKYGLTEIYVEDRAESCVHHIAFTGLEFETRSI